MSDPIPFDLQVEIIKRLPTKSLLKFRAVSKAWKSLIHNAKFIADYNPQSQNLLIRSRYYQRDACKYEYKYVKIVDDDTFPQHKFSLTVPSCVNIIMLRDIGCSQGLFCLFGYHPNMHNPLYMSIIWNPSIRKSVAIVVPKMLHNCVLGFGVCPNTNDPKIVNIQKVTSTKEMESVTFCPWDVEVFTLSSRVWRRPLSKLPDKWFDIICGDNQVVIDGFIYLFAYERIALNDGFYTIIAFDLTSEEFNQVYLPDKLATNSIYYGPIFKLRESLAVVKSKMKAEKQVYKVWLMENGVSKSFMKIFTINLPYASVRTILGFRSNGDIIMEMRDDDDHDSVMLVVCEPGSERINKLGISEDHGGSFFVSSYKESLLLHDQPNICTLTDFH